MKPFKPKVYPRINCAMCKKDMPLHRKWQRFCSKKCKNDNYRRTHKMVLIEDI